MIIGYARTSTIDQTAGFESQFKELEGVKCQKIFRDQTSSVTARAQLEAALDFIREGDVLVVTKLDRLARSVGNLMRIIQALERKGAGLRVLNLGMETSTHTGKLMLTVLGGIAQFEREMMLERQREGVAKAKAAGKYKGRKPTPDVIRHQAGGGPSCRREDDKDCYCWSTKQWGSNCVPDSRGSIKAKILLHL